MKAVFVVLVLTVCFAVSLAQNDFMRRYMMANMLQTQGRPGASGGQAAGASGGVAGNPLLSMLGRGGAMSPLMLAMGNDRIRDLILCNHMPASMKQICMMTAMA